MTKTSRLSTIVSGVRANAAGSPGEDESSKIAAATINLSRDNLKVTAP
jgi:hypothetical protein